MRVGCPKADTALWILKRYLINIYELGGIFVDKVTLFLTEQWWVRFTF